MVKQTKAHGLACLLQAHGQVIVLAAWHGIATWMIVCKDKVGGTCYESMPQNQTNIHRGFRYAATTYDMMPHELILNIQQEEMTLLVRHVAHLNTEIVVSIGRRSELCLGTFGFKQKALAQFHRRLYGNSLGRTYAVILFQLLTGKRTKGTKTVAMLTENFAHKINAGNLRCATADKYGQKFGIANRLGPQGHDTLARPFVV